MIPSEDDGAGSGVPRPDRGRRRFAVSAPTMTTAQTAHQIQPVPLALGFVGAGE